MKRFATFNEVSSSFWRRFPPGAPASSLNLARTYVVVVQSAGDKKSNKQCWGRVVREAQTSGKIF